MLRVIAASLVLSLAPLPALAGTAEDAFLARLVGKWSGTGNLSGGETGSFGCTATIRNRSDGVNFSVKCDVPEFGAQNFSGAVSYNDAKGQYEAKSPGGELTIGIKKGNAVIFDAKMKGIANGNSIMTLTASKVSVDTKVKRPGKDVLITSKLELKKS